MSKTLQFRRYTTANLASVTGAVGELIVDVTKNIVTVHDGSTAGGWAGASAAYVAGIDAAQNTSIGLAWNTANLAYAQANTDLTYLAANVANLLNIDTSVNSAIQLASNTANSASANTIYLSGIETSQNANIVIALAQANGANGMAVGAYAQANAVFNTANASFNTANAAFAAANTSAQTIPQNAQTTNYVLQSSDAGKYIYYTQSANVNLYIPWTANTLFANGTTVMIVSQTTSSANVTIVANTGVSLYLAGNTTSASRNVTTYGMATLMMVKANTWYINGSGVV